MRKGEWSQPRRRYTYLSTRRIKRSRLFRDEVSEDSGATTRSPSPESLGANTQKNDPDNFQDVTYGFEYDFVTLKSAEMKPAVTSETQEADPEEQDEPEYRFRLFASASSSKAQQTQPEATKSQPKIRLSATPEPAALAEALSLENAHFIRPNRPDSYYFTSNTSEEVIHRLKLEYQDVAMSTSDVLSQAKSTRWWGTALPWRSIHVQLLTKAPKTKRPAESKQGPTRTRTRPSKKRRVLHRRRLALREGLAAQTKVGEETEREKRTRRNREKKVKKKERDKRKKLEAQDGIELGMADGEIQSKGEAKEVTPLSKTISSRALGSTSTSRPIPVEFSPRNNPCRPNSGEN